MLDANGAITEWFGAAVDITARKHAEEALLRSEQLASLGRVAHTIAHEINNPLEALTNLVFLACNSDGLPPSARSLLEEADSQLQRVAHITRLALGFYRDSAVPALVQIDTVIESTIDLFKGKITLKNAVMETQLRTREEVMAVAGEIRPAFSNLFANSIDAIEMHGVIKIRTSICTSSHSRRCLRITLADNGKGVDPAARDCIFEPLYTTKDETGTGLGLWVTKQIVERHGGAIRYRSQSNGPRTGSTFSVTLLI